MRFRPRVKTETLQICDQSIKVEYFQFRTPLGRKRFTAVVELGCSDQVILDGDSLIGVEAQVRECIDLALRFRR